MGAKDESVRLGGLTFRRAWSAEVPEISPDRRAALKASIEEFGVLDPVDVRGVADDPTAFDVIDGWNRLGIAAELDVECPYRVLTATDDAARKMAIDLAAARRQLDAEQVALLRRLRVAEARANGKSLREIASDEGVSKSQVERDIETVKQKQLSPPGTVEPEKVKGRDGKTRTATPKKAAKVTVSDELVEKVVAALKRNPGAKDHHLASVCGCTAAEAKAARKAAKKLTPPDDGPKPEPPEGETAARRNEREATDHVAEVEAVCYELDGIAGRLDGLGQSRFAKHTIHAESAAASVRAVRKQLWVGRACHRCPYCGGAGCEPDKAGRSVCNRTGWVKKSTADAGKDARGGAA